VATSLNSMALVLRDRGALEEAEPFLRESLAMRQKLFGEEHDRTAGARYQLARLLLDTGRPDDAEPLFRQALLVSEATNGKQHWKTAIARVGLGGVLITLGRYEEAELLLLEAHAYYQREDAEGPPRAADALEALVELYTAWGKPEQAAAFQAALTP
jgi:tetratricopeptide (TPR) repeat protein